MAGAALLSLFKRSSSCQPGQTCEKPTSKVLTDGVPGIVFGIFIIVSLIVLSILYHRRKKQDDLEDLEDRRRHDGYYVRDGLTRFGDPADADSIIDYSRDGPSQRNFVYQSAPSNASSGALFAEYRQDEAPHYASSTAVTESTSDITPKRTEDGWRNLIGPDQKPDRPH